ncbi:hypothetical protein [Nocardia vermiculata]|uniref:Secreted protein n=1 Tax=Nocardia vermiculata TaxID=257274 RepID=A0A846XW23_9NOCA|nr:hypothetical protein [Nocardia vermiculata]NKY50837.1 hypothetical protein [Nocardia vermiculata]
MRIITTGIAAAAVAAATVVGAGAASAADDPGLQAPDEIITIDINLLGCSLGAGLGAELIPTLSSEGNGSNIGLNSGFASRLRAAGCLPGR